MMSHGCVLLWSRLDIAIAINGINEIQRLVCICITGAVKSTTTAVMEILAAVPQIQTVRRAKAFVTADMLAQNELWTRNFASGHGCIRKMMKSEFVRH